MPAKRPLKDRFFDKICYNPSVIRTYVPKDGGPSTTVIRGCFEWNASTISGPSNKGYGQIQEGGRGSRKLKAHRVRYSLETGLEIPKGLCICHRCDNPLCVTFAHLFLGTPAENSKDRDQKGRRVAPKGEKQGNATVSDLDKEKVVDLYATGQYTMKELAESVGVKRQTVGDWVHGRWRAS